MTLKKSIHYFVTVVSHFKIKSFDHNSEGAEHDITDKYYIYIYQLFMTVTAEHVIGI